MSQKEMCIGIVVSMQICWYLITFCVSRRRRKMYCGIELECSCVCISACSYDHVRGDKTSATKTATSTDCSPSHCSASRRPVHLHSGISSDVTSQMTSLNRHRFTESRLVSVDGMTHSLLVLLQFALVTLKLFNILNIYAVNHQKTWQFIFDYNFG